MNTSPRIALNLPRDIPHIFYHDNNLYLYQHTLIFNNALNKFFGRTCIPVANVVENCCPTSKGGERKGGWGIDFSVKMKRMLYHQSVRNHLATVLCVLYRAMRRILCILPIFCVDQPNTIY